MPWHSQRLSTPDEASAADNLASKKRILPLSSPSSISSDNERSRLQQNRPKRARSSLKSAGAAPSSSDSKEGTRTSPNSSSMINNSLNNRTSRKLSFSSDEDGHDDDNGSGCENAAEPRPARVDNNPLLASTPVLSSPPSRGIQQLRLHEKKKKKRRRAPVASSPVGLPRPESASAPASAPAPAPVSSSPPSSSSGRPRRRPLPVFHAPPAATAMNSSLSSQAARGAVRPQLACSWRRQSSSSTPRSPALAAGAPGPGKTDEEQGSVKKSRYANVNPFTPKPQALLDASRKSINKDYNNNNASDSFYVGASEQGSSIDIDPDTAAADQAAKAFLGAMNSPCNSTPTKCHNRLKDSSLMATPTLSSSSQRRLGWHKVNAFKSSPTTANFHLACGEPLAPPTSSKRLSIHDMNISRFTEEFVEIGEVAAGRFGKVKVAKHRLDGMIYAVKVSKNPIVGSGAERSAFNEVFAHAALMRHRNIVSYYNAWVEADRVFIQSEYCERGSLAELIDKKRAAGERFTECELKRILLHVARGLEHFHCKGLVHLDIKPENILLTHDLGCAPSPKPPAAAVSVEEAAAAESSEDCHRGNADKHDEEEDEDPLASVDINAAAALDGEDAILDVQDMNLEFLVESGSSRMSSQATAPQETTTETLAQEQRRAPESTDSGTHSAPDTETLPDKVVYKIGDLGHVAMVTGSYDPEEGDCRYMAPEMLVESNLRRRAHLPKADVFSLGMTLYECASLRNLPRNSSDGSDYAALKSGQLPHVDGYSDQFNQLIRSMVITNPMFRPSSQRLVRHPLVAASLRKAKSSARLAEELRVTNAKLQLLQDSVSRFKARVKRARRDKMSS